MTAFDVTLSNSAGHSTLNVPDAPQDLTITFVNRAAKGVQTTRAIGPRRLDESLFHLKLRFRPGTLANTEAVRLAPESGEEWCMRLIGAPDGTQVLLLGRTSRNRWLRGESASIRLQGLSADPRGGTRATRVEVEMSSLAYTAGPAPRTVTFHQLLQLRIARSKAGAFDLARQVRSGSAARSGPFVAGFPDGPSVLNDGVSPVTLRVLVVNTSSRPIDVSDDDDAASRIEIDYHTARGSVPWGLLGSSSDHVTISLSGVAGPASGQLPMRMWELDNHLVRCTRRHRWGEDDWLELELTVHTSAPPGDVQLVVRYVDFPGIDDGELVLLAHLSPLAIRSDAIDATKSIRLWGAETALEFRTRGVDGDLARPADASLSISPDRSVELAGFQISLRSSETIIHADATTVSGALSIGNALEVGGSLTARDLVTANGQVNVLGALEVGSTLTAKSKVTVADTLEVANAITAKSKVAVADTLEVANAITAKSKVTVADTLEVGSTLTAKSKVTVAGTLEVANAITAKGAFDALVGLGIGGGIPSRPSASVLWLGAVRLFAESELFVIRIVDNLWFFTSNGARHFTKATLDGLSPSSDFSLLGHSDLKPVLTSMKLLVAAEEAVWTARQRS